MCSYENNTLSFVNEKLITYAKFIRIMKSFMYV